MSDELRWTQLKEMRVSPLHFRHRKLNPPKESPSYLLGTATHMSVLEPERFASDVVVFTGAARRGKAWDEFEQANALKLILTEKEYARVLSMSLAVRCSPAFEILSDPNRKAEIELKWRLGARECAGRIDLIARDRLVELKTANHTAPSAWPSISARYGYHCQIGWYYYGARANGLLGNASGEPLQIVVNSNPPHDVLLWDVPIEVVNKGLAECMDLVAKLDRCELENKWPGAADGKSLKLTLPERVAGPGDEDEQEQEAA